MVDFLISYWFIILIGIAASAVCGYFIRDFVSLPTNEQISKVKEWLLYAVASAEKELGGGTGQIKLRYVYNLFLEKFPQLSIIISFNKFSDMVDEVLDKFKNILSSNQKLQDYIEK